MESTFAAWTRYLAGFSTDNVVRDSIIASWDRSRAAQVDPRPADVKPRRVDDVDLAMRKAQSAALLDVAIPHLEWISAYLGARGHASHLVDPDGIVLFSTGSPELLEALPLSPGYDWSEGAMGTNGAGTALVTGSPVAVVGPEHFVERWHGCTCTGAPIRGPDGHILGAIGVTTASRAHDPERLAIVSHVAWTIERELVTLMLRDRLHSHERVRRVVQAAVQNLPNAILVASTDRTFVCASRGAQKLLDEAGLGIDLHRIGVATADGTRMTLDSLVERARLGEHVDIQGRCMCGDEVCPMAICATPLWDGAHIVGVIVTFAAGGEECLESGESGPCSCRRQSA